MSERSHERRESRPAREHRPDEQRDKEERQEHDGVPHDWTNGNNTDTDERARVLLAVPVGERLHEHVRDDEDGGHADREDDLGEDDAPPLGTGSIAGHLVRWVPQLLLLVTSDHRTGQTTVAVPRASLGTRVTTRHPAEELAVVDDEVRERELVRVEDERSQTQRKRRNPEINHMRYPERDRHIKQHDQRPHPQVDTRTSKS